MSTQEPSHTIDVANCALPVVGTAAYWQASREAFALLRRLRCAIRNALDAPAYVAGAWDDDYGDCEPVENLGPWEHAEDLLKAVRAHPYACRVVAAHGITTADLDPRCFRHLVERLP